MLTYVFTDGHTVKGCPSLIQKRACHVPNIQKIQTSGYKRTSFFKNTLRDRK